MKIVAHLNDGKGLIKAPVILIAESELNSVEDIHASIDPSLNPVIVDESTLPSKSYMNAWNLVNGQVGVDMPLAREIARSRIRGLRTNKLSALDIAFQRALETGADTKDIVAQKQALRDAPNHPAIETATTTAELDNAITTILGA